MIRHPDKMQMAFFVRDAGGGTRVLHSNRTSPFVHDMTSFVRSKLRVNFFFKEAGLSTRYLNGLLLPCQVEKPNAIDDSSSLWRKSARND